MRRSVKDGVQATGALELIEEAVHLLRTAPAGALAFYYAGTLPFALGLLYFWTEMSRSADAWERLPAAALGMATLFLWMKWCQSLFALRLRAHRAGSAMSRLGLGRCARIFIAQAALQPSGLFLLPLASIPVLPFGWVYAFYQNITVLADGDSADAGDLFGKARHQAALWPRQNHALLGVMCLFGFCIFLNWVSLTLALPSVLKMLFGIEPPFRLSALSMLNTTFFAAMFCVTWLCVDPILKSLYVLRCFYGQALRSGEDLRAELKQFEFTTKLTTKLTTKFWMLICLLAMPVKAAAPVSGTAGTELSPEALDRTIGEVVQQRKYAWRTPPGARTAQPDKGSSSGFLARASELIRDWLRAAGELVQKVFEWLFRGQKTSKSPHMVTLDSTLLLKLLLCILLIAILGGLGFLIYRVLQARRRPAMQVFSQPIQATPDLADDNVGAEQLPESGWMGLARELLARGELRLALRAFYFASLTRLAERNLITLARFKSNRDYESELSRRAHSFPDLIAVFGENVVVFDRTWYGLHQVDSAMVGRFVANVDRIGGRA